MTRNAHGFTESVKQHLSNFTDSVKPLHLKGEPLSVNRAIYDSVLRPDHRVTAGSDLPACTRCRERPRRAANQRWCNTCCAAYERERYQARKGGA